jgi:hypothetical protein
MLCAPPLAFCSPTLFTPRVSTRTETRVNDGGNPRFVRFDDTKDEPGFNWYDASAGPLYSMSGAGGKLQLTSWFAWGGVIT